VANTPNRFSPKLEANLRHAGWFPGRRVDEAVIYDRCASVIKELGCRMFPTAFNILREFGGLHITVIPDNAAYNDSAPIEVWPLPCVSSPRVWFTLEWEFGEALFPVANYAEGEMSLFVASSGRVYAYGYGYWYCGNTFEKALENLKVAGGQIERMSILDFDEKRQESQRVYDALIQPSAQH